jgi:hypothetical protein
MSGSPPSLTWESPEKQISEWNGELIRPSLDIHTVLRLTNQSQLRAADRLTSTMLMGLVQ